MWVSISGKVAEVTESMLRPDPAIEEKRSKELNKHNHRQEVLIQGWVLINLTSRLPSILQPQCKVNQSNKFWSVECKIVWYTDVA